MISSLSISFEGKTITIHDVYNNEIDGVYADRYFQENDGRICYLEMREDGRKIWAKTFSTDILEAATCVCIYSPMRKQILLGYGLKVYALDEYTGKLEWLIEVETPVHAIFLDDFDNIFIQNEISIVKLGSNGNKQWEYSHYDIISQVILNTTELLISDITQAEYRIDIAEGKLLS